jgi:hypothetical protein
MEGTNLTIVQNVADNLITAQTVYDITGERVGTVDDIDRDTGWFKLEINPLSDKVLYIPFKIVTTIDPKELYVSATKEALYREFSNPPARFTTVETVDGQEIATTRQASGLDGTAIIVDEVNVDKVRKGIGEGYVILTSDEVSLGTIKRYDTATGWILVGKTALTKYDLVVPVSVVSRIDRQFGAVHLAVSEADLKAMKHLEPVDVVFVGTPPVTAA